MAIATDYVDRPGLKLCYSAARLAAKRTLREDDSLFTPGQPIWSLTNIRDLYDRFVRHPDASADTFEVKFRRQLNGAPAATIQLAGELLYIHFLIPADMSGQAKRTLINEVLSWSPNPVTVPDELATTLDDGFVTVGMAQMHRPSQLRFMLDFYKGWKQLDDAERARLLKDPWAFKTWVWDIPVERAQSQREALLHIVHPKTFEDIISQKYKRKIADAFSDRVSTSANDVDRQLLEIRQSLTAEAGHPISYYSAPLRGQWLDDRPPTSPPSPGPQPTRQRAWLVRGANAQGQSLVPDWLNQGYCSVRWEEIEDVARGASRSQSTSLVNESYPDDSPRVRRHHVDNLDSFLNQMSVRDLVVTADGSKIYVGTVKSDPEYLGLQGGLAPLRRQVHWANPTLPIGRDELSHAALAKLRTHLTVSEVTDDIAEYAQLADIGTEGPTEPPPERIHLPQPDEALTEQLLLPQEWLAETVELLDEKRQVIFYGPPGTGKTWTAMQLAAYLIQSGGEVLPVQFHPSYAYEDFVEGFRPQSGADGPSVQFELVPGPLRQLADLARADRAHPYILVIDEINRANLAKVFGELYFLLEYRDQSIALQYSPSMTFTLPDNLFVIGTMNTADRSIALVDAAMRRRFYFIPFLPSEEPIKGLLRRWLERRGLDDTPADLIEELNRRIDDPEAAIGPSYLMAQSAVTSAGLKRVWRHAILPLLAERYYGHPINLEQRFGYDSLLRAVTIQPDAEGGLVEDFELG